MPKFNTKDVTKPKEGLVVMKAAYWLCVDGDPTKALFFGNAPQTNKDKRIPEWSLKQDRYKAVGNLQIIYIETAYAPRQD